MAEDCIPIGDRWREEAARDLSDVVEPVHMFLACVRSIGGLRSTLTQSIGSWDQLRRVLECRSAVENQIAASMGDEVLFKIGYSKASTLCIQEWEKELKAKSSTEDAGSDLWHLLLARILWRSTPIGQKLEAVGVPEDTIDALLRE